jgi:pyruvate,water dikinase
VLVRYSGSLRRLLLAIGGRFAAHEILDRAADIFYLRRREIEDLLAGPTVTTDRTMIRSLVSSRQEEHRRLLALPAPPRLLAELPDGRCVPFEPEVQSGEILRGFGASPGRIGGRARVLHDIGRAGDLEPGEILVTRTTDIGWTPLFQIAAAVITEIGALASHAAIVARELGLPAVVNLDRATERIRSGDRLFVDGWAGTVRILHEPGAKE